MQHNWERYFDTESEYWKKIQKIYEENDNYPKIVVSGRNLHHKFLRTFSRLEGTEIDNDKENLVSLSEGDHFLVHYYLWKCTKVGFRNRTGTAVRFMYKKAVKYLTDEIAELIAKEWTGHTLGGGYKCSEETKRKISKKLRGKPTGRKGEIIPDDVKQKIKKSVKKIYEKRGTDFISKATKKAMENPEIRKKISEAKKGKPCINKGKKWFTNGIENKMSFTCPEGFWEGMTKKIGE